MSILTLILDSLSSSRHNALAGLSDHINNREGLVGSTVSLNRLLLWKCYGNYAGAKVASWSNNDERVGSFLTVVANIFPCKLFLIRGLWPLRYFCGYYGDFYDAIIKLNVPDYFKKLHV